MFYEFTQNNSHGYFEVDDKVCYKLLIEADDSYDAKTKAEELGCYWNGVLFGIDCPCCGDRWGSCEKIDSERLKSYTVWDYASKSNWRKKYGKFNIIEKPTKDEFGIWSGTVSFSNIEEYAQCLANKSGHTKPDVRIFYKDGTVKDIFKEN